MLSLVWAREKFRNSQRKLRFWIANSLIKHTFNFISLTSRRSSQTACGADTPIETWKEFPSIHPATIYDSPRRSFPLHCTLELLFTMIAALIQLSRRMSGEKRRLLVRRKCCVMQNVDHKTDDDSTTTMTCWRFVLCDKFKNIFRCWDDVDGRFDVLIFSGAKCFCYSMTEGWLGEEILIAHFKPSQDALQAWTWSWKVKSFTWAVKCLVSPTSHFAWQDVCWFFEGFDCNQRHGEALSPAACGVGFRALSFRRVAN